MPEPEYYWSLIEDRPKRSLSSLSPHLLDLCLSRGCLNFASKHHAFCPVCLKAWHNIATINHVPDGIVRMFVRFSQTAILLAVFLAGCASEPQQKPTSQTEYGGFKFPFTVPKTDPVVPPAGKPEPPPPDPCPGLCSTLCEENSECASRNTSCQRIIQSMGSANNDTCRKRDQQCARADRALATVEKNNCTCDCE